MKELKLDLCDTLEIITHPMHLPLIYTSLKKLQTSMEEEGLFFPRIPPISSSHYLDPYRPTGDWTRTDVCPDNTYITWVPDIKNPPSWAIYFGLVETETEPNILLMKKTVQPIPLMKRQKDFNKADDEFTKSINRIRFDTMPITRDWQNPFYFRGNV